MMDIVERLEDGQVCSAAENWCRNRPTMEQAADEITRLRAENERMRAALAPTPERLVELVDVVLHDMGEPTPPARLLSLVAWCHPHVYAVASRARLALECLPPSVVHLGDLHGHRVVFNKRRLPVVRQYLDPVFVEHLRIGHSLNSALRAAEATVCRSHDCCGITRVRQSRTIVRSILS